MRFNTLDHRPQGSALVRQLIVVLAGPPAECADAALGHPYPIHIKLMPRSDSVNGDVKQDPWDDAQDSSSD